MSLPDGVRMRIEPVGEQPASAATPPPEPPAAEQDGEATTGDDQGPTPYDRMNHLIGIFDGLPEDFAKNHDHYIHGAPKRRSTAAARTSTGRPTTASVSSSWPNAG